MPAEQACHQGGSSGQGEDRPGAGQAALMRARQTTRSSAGLSAGKGGMAMVLNLVLIGLAVTLDPLPLTAFLVVLPSQRGTVKGAAFTFGWLVSLAIVVAITVLATGNNPPEPETAPSLASLAVKIVIGAILIL